MTDAKIGGIMKKKDRIILVFISLLSIIPPVLYSQDKTLISPYLQLQYFKNTDGQRSLKATLTYSRDRIEYPLAGREISFYLQEGEKKLIGTVATDEKGIAQFDLPESLKKGGSWTFINEYSGNDTIEAVTSELSIKDVILEMTLSVADTIKTVTVRAYTSENNRDIPVADETVLIYVPRMFSMLPVGEAYLDATGTASIEFPNDLPGDTEGNITIISKFEEHATFGNVEQVTVQKWGIPVSDTIPVAHRALWTKTPPMWMIITLSILLTGVWGHYLFAIISLILIKHESRKHRKEKNQY